MPKPGHHKTARVIDGPTVLTGGNGDGGKKGAPAKSLLSGTLKPQSRLAAEVNLSGEQLDKEFYELACNRMGRQLADELMKSFSEDKKREFISLNKKVSFARDKIDELRNVTRQSTLKELNNLRASMDSCDIPVLDTFVMQGGLENLLDLLIWYKTQKEDPEIGKKQHAVLLAVKACGNCDVILPKFLQSRRAIPALMASLESKDDGALRETMYLLTCWAAMKKGDRKLLDALENFRLVHDLDNRMSFFVSYIQKTPDTQSRTLAITFINTLLTTQVSVSVRLGLIEELRTPGVSGILKLVINSTKAQIRKCQARDGDGKKATSALMGVDDPLPGLRRLQNQYKVLHSEVERASEYRESLQKIDCDLDDLEGVTLKLMERMEDDPDRDKFMDIMRTMLLVKQYAPTEINALCWGALSELVSSVSDTFNIPQNGENSESRTDIRLSLTELHEKLRAPMEFFGFFRLPDVNSQDGKNEVVETTTGRVIITKKYYETLKELKEKIYPDLETRFTQLKQDLERVIENGTESKGPSSSGAIPDLPSGFSSNQGSPAAGNLPIPPPQSVVPVPAMGHPPTMSSPAVKGVPSMGGVPPAMGSVPSMKTAPAMGMPAMGAPMMGPPTMGPPTMRQSPGAMNCASSMARLPPPINPPKMSSNGMMNNVAMMNGVQMMDQPAMSMGTPPGMLSGPPSMSEPPSMRGPPSMAGPRMGGPPSMNRPGPSAPMKPVVPAVPKKKNEPPKSQMKRLTWEKVPDNLAQNTIWKTLGKEDIPIEIPFFKSFESQVAQPVDSQESRKEATKARTSNVVSIIESGRSRAIAISLSRIKVSLDDLRKAIITLDTKIIDQEGVEAIVNNAIPESDEIEAVKAHVEEHPEDRPKLARVEEYILTISDIPSFGQRMTNWNFVLTFPNSISVLRREFNQVYYAFEVLQKSKKFHKFLQIVLSIGNYMNGGTSNGGAWGFKLGSLNSLASCRDTAGKRTLLHAVLKYCAQLDEEWRKKNSERASEADYYIETIDKNGYLSEEAMALHQEMWPLEYPILGFISEASVFNIAKNVGIPESQAEFNGIRRKFDTIERMVTNNKLSTSLPNDRYTDVMKQFITHEKSNIDGGKKDMDRMDESFKSMCSMFGEIPEKLPPSDFLGKIVSFLSSCQTAISDNTKDQEEEERLRARAAQKKAVAKASREFAGVRQKENKGEDSMSAAMEIAGRKLGLGTSEGTNESKSGNNENGKGLLDDLMNALMDGGAFQTLRRSRR